jgi:hypothetical protein
MTSSRSGTERFSFGVAARMSAASLSLTLLSWASPAWSQTAQEQALAEALFRDGRELLERGEYAAACGKLGESYRLDPASGTLLNLALCHEQEGKLATAWVEYQNALARVRREGSEERISFARDAIARVEPRVPRVRIEVTETEGQAITVELDGTPLGRAAWGGEMPVDPGTVYIRATAREHRPYEAELTIVAGQVLTAKIPALVREAGPAPLQATASSHVENPRPAAPVSKTSESAPSMTNDNRRVTAYVATGAGVLGVAAGTYFGIVAILQKQESDPKCPGGVCETDEDLSLYQTAQLNANLSNVGFGLGLVGLGVGAYLFLTEPAAAPSGVDAKQGPKQGSQSAQAHRDRSSWTALPTLQADSAGVSVSGTF